MIDAAHELFLDRGVDAVSLADIVRISGGSLSTLYELFENKHGLLAAIIEEYGAVDLATVDAIAAQDIPPSAKLASIAEEIHGRYSKRETIGLLRLVITETLRSPAFAHKIYEDVHRPIAVRLTRLFDEWTSNGEAQIADSRVAAELFLGLIIHPLQTHAFFGEPAGLAALSLPSAIRDATMLFLTGYRIQ